MLRPSRETEVAALSLAVERLLEPGSNRARHSNLAATGPAGPRGRRRPCPCPWSSPCLCRPGLQSLCPILCLRLRLCLCPFRSAPRICPLLSWCIAGRRVPCPCNLGKLQHQVCRQVPEALGTASMGGLYRDIPSTRALALNLLCLYLCLSGTHRGRRLTETTRPMPGHHRGATLALEQQPVWGAVPAVKTKDPRRKPATGRGPGPPVSCSVLLAAARLRCRRRRPCRLDFLPSRFWCSCEV